MAFVLALYRDFCIVTIIVVSFRSIEYIVVKKQVVVANWKRGTWREASYFHCGRKPLRLPRDVWLLVICVIRFRYARLHDMISSRHTSTFVHFDHTIMAVLFVLVVRTKRNERTPLCKSIALYLLVILYYIHAAAAVPRFHFIPAVIGMHVGPQHRFEWYVIIAIPNMNMFESWPRIHEHAISHHRIHGIPFDHQMECCVQECVLHTTCLPQCRFRIWNINPSTTCIFEFIGLHHSFRDFFFHAHHPPGFIRIYTPTGQIQSI